MSNSIAINARAKVNLFLDVFDRRPDGYHDIRSLLVPVALCDRLVVQTADAGIRLLVESKVGMPGLPWLFDMGPHNRNLAVKAARLLRRATGWRGGAVIRLQKNIPVAAGMGGGSADAAAVLLALNKLWATGLRRGELMRLALQLGCDVPALVHGGAVCMTGRGEEVRPAGWRPGWRPWVLLVNPGFGVSTGDIYGRYSQRLTSRSENNRFNTLLGAVGKGDGRNLPRVLFNALQDTVFEKYPLLKLIKDAMVAAGAGKVLLSGSGATLFAPVRDAAHARAVSAGLRRAVDFPLWTRPARLLGGRSASPRWSDGG